MPGAYLRCALRNASAAGCIVSVSPNSGCPAPSMPMVEHSVDNGPFVSIQLVGGQDEQVVPLFHGEDAALPHQVEVFFRSAKLSRDRWTSSTYNLRLAGFAANDGATLSPAPRRSKNAIAFGDSITEGVYADLRALEPGVVYYGNLAHNNARTTWLSSVCAALGCEYGQLGTGGQGMVVRHLQMPPLAETWDHYDRDHSRLTGGRLLPQPDYAFCEMCTNDFVLESGLPRHLDVTDAALQWLAAFREACPETLVFCIVPPLGWHADQLARAVSAARARGDTRVHLVDTAPLRHLFRQDAPTQAACDGVHPHGHGNALLAALVTAEVQKQIDAHEEPPPRAPR